MIHEEQYQQKTHTHTHTHTKGELTRGREREGLQEEAMLAYGLSTIQKSEARAWLLKIELFVSPPLPCLLSRPS
jgi:hypothetical protein